MKKRFSKLSENMRLNIEKNREKEAEKLRKLLTEIRYILERQGIDVDENCRIEMKAFDDIYGSEEISKDFEYVKEVRDDKGDTLLKDGERFEVLKTIVFHKFLNEKFIIVRAAPYDDVRNHVDNLIIEKRTGNIVCAFDEVSTISGPAFIKKQERFLRNNKNGARVKYGVLSIEDVFEKGRIEEIPIFYLALPPEQINKGIKNLESLNEISDYEKNLWTYFIIILKSQIARLKLEENLNKILKSRLLEFEKIITELKE